MTCAALRWGTGSFSARRARTATTPFVPTTAATDYRTGSTIFRAYYDTFWTTASATYYEGNIT